MAKEKSRRPAELSLRTISKLWRLMEVAAMIYSKCRNEPKSIIVYHGTFQHQYDKLLRTRDAG